MPTCGVDAFAVTVWRLHAAARGLLPRACVGFPATVPQAAWRGALTDSRGIPMRKRLSPQDQAFVRSCFWEGVRAGLVVGLFEGLLVWLVRPLARSIG